MFDKQDRRPQRFQRMGRWVALMALSIALLTTAGCRVQTEQILGVQEGSNLQILAGFSISPVMPLTGGTVVGLDISIGLFELLFGHVDGDIELKELLLAAPGYTLLAVLPTDEICIFPASATPAPGTFDSNIYSGESTFAIDIDTLAEFQNPEQQARVVGGALPFPFSLSDTQNLSIGELFGLLGGSGELAFEQAFSEPIVLEFQLSPNAPIQNLSGFAAGTVSLASTDTFPTSPDIEVCANNLAND